MEFRPQFIRRSTHHHDIKERERSSETKSTDSTRIPTVRVPTSGFLRSARHSTRLQLPRSCRICRISATATRVSWASELLSRRSYGSYSSTRLLQPTTTTATASKWMASRMLGGIVLLLHDGRMLRILMWMNMSQKVG